MLMDDLALAAFWGQCLAKNLHTDCVLTGDTPRISARTSNAPIVRPSWTRLVMQYRQRAINEWL
jgi:hypothetical protein